MSIALPQRFRDAVKATRMVFSRGYGGWGRFDNLTDPWPRDAFRLNQNAGAYDPKAAAGDLSANAVVAICVGWVVRNQMQARLTVQAPDANGVLAPVPEHPLLALIRRPNEHYGRKELLGAVASDYLVDGNALLIKLFDRGGTLRELWWAPRHMWRLADRKDKSDFSPGYIYTVAGEAPITLKPEEVVHFRYPRLDPIDPRLGLAPLQALIREIGLDNSISTANGALVANGGQPGIIIAPKIRPEDPPMTALDAESIRHQYSTKFSGNGAGQAMVLTFEAELHKPTFSPEEMKLDVIGHRPEARITASFGLQASAVGLSVGEAQRTYSNLKESREASWEECLIPMLDSVAEDLSRQLLPDLDKDLSREVGWDLGEVRALREDEDAKSTRALAEWEKNALTFNELREKIGQAKVEESRGKLYFSEWGQALNPALPPVASAAESAGDAAVNEQNGNVPALNGNG